MLANLFTKFQSSVSVITVERLHKMYIARMKSGIISNMKTTAIISLIRTAMIYPER